MNNKGWSLTDIFDDESMLSNQRSNAWSESFDWYKKSPCNCLSETR